MYVHVVMKILHVCYKNELEANLNNLNTVVLPQ